MPNPGAEAQHPLAHDFQLVRLGFDWIAHALANYDFQQGILTPETFQKREYEKTIFSRHGDRIAEALREFRAAAVLRQDDEERLAPTYFPSPQSEYYFLMYTLTSMAQMVLESQEKLRQTQVIMVAGHQGAGKGLVAELLQKQGYQVLSMSQIVREVAAVWGFSPSLTNDKIATGQLLKEFFGKGVLVDLALQYLVSENDQVDRIVIDGPRLVEEAETVLRNGGRLIGIRTSQNPTDDLQIRRQRVVDRAQREPQRAGDIDKFDDREKAEHQLIEKILQLIPESDILVNDVPQPAALETKLLALLGK